MSRIAELLFPPKCVSCRSILPLDSDRSCGGDVLCRDCRMIFEAEKYKRCSRCGKQHFECECMPDALADSPCCALMHVCSYDRSPIGPVTGILFTLKKRANGACERFAAEQLATRLSEYLDSNSDCDFCVSYAPRRRRAVIRFGYDHGEVLAGRVAKLCGLEFLKFIKNNSRGKAQKNLKSAERFKNVAKAFAPSRKIRAAKGKNVILIDDVITSGASLAACTSILIEAGAASVTCLCFAITEKKRKSSIDKNV